MLPAVADHDLIARWAELDGDQRGQVLDYLATCHPRTLREALTWEARTRP